jgi:hypothetical protein
MTFTENSLPKIPEFQTSATEERNRRTCSVMVNSSSCTVASFARIRIPVLTDSSLCYVFSPISTMSPLKSLSSVWWTVYDVLWSWRGAVPPRPLTFPRCETQTQTQHNFQWVWNYTCRQDILSTSFVPDIVRLLSGKVRLVHLHHDWGRISRVLLAELQFTGRKSPTWWHAPFYFIPFFPLPHSSPPLFNPSERNSRVQFNLPSLNSYHP